MRFEERRWIVRFSRSFFNRHAKQTSEPAADHKAAVDQPAAEFVDCECDEDVADEADEAVDGVVDVDAASVRDQVESESVKDQRIDHVSKSDIRGSKGKIFVSK